MLSNAGRHEEAAAEIAVALRLDPESYEVNYRAAYISYRQGRLAEAVPYFEKATALVETDLNAPFMLVSCYTALGDGENTRRAPGSPWKGPRRPSPRIAATARPWAWGSRPWRLWARRTGPRTGCAAPC
jgi:tetratricopeptide (TPR) repeat protein